MTGKAAGYCAGYPVPGCMNPIPRMGVGFRGAAEVLGALRRDRGGDQGRA